MKKVFFVIILIFLFSCVRLSDVARQFAELQNIEFRLASIKDVRVGGINIDRKRKVEDFSVLEGLTLAKVFAGGTVPIDFILIVEAKNPNYDRQKNLGVSARILSFGFDLFVDDVRVAAGNITNPIELPHKGRPVDIPIKISFDMLEMFGGESYKKLAKLGLNISGFKTGKVDFRMEATPRIETPIGNLSPGRITILKKKF
jgi:hypothetical protein